MNDILRDLDCYDDRLRSIASCHRWATLQWHARDGMNRFAVMPTRRTHTAGKWPQDARDHYAGLYPRDKFVDFLDFCAFEFFISSVEQTIIRDRIPDGSWFRRDTPEGYASRLVEFFLGIASVHNAEAVRRWLRFWELPDEIGWVQHLSFRQGLTRESRDQIELWADSDEGYLVFLVIDG